MAERSPVRSPLCNLVKLPRGGSMLNVFVEQFQFVPLLSQLHAQQVTNGEHSDPTLAIYDWQMSGADEFHPFEGLMGGLVTPDHRTQLAGNFSYSNGERIALSDNHTLQNVAFRKDA